MEKHLSEHPTADELRAYLRGQSGRHTDTGAWIVRHLLRGCATCQKNLQTLRRELQPSFRVSRSPGSADAEPTAPCYDAVFARVEKTLSLFLSNGQAAEEPPGSLLAELAPLPAGELGRLRSSGPILPFLIKWLIARSHAARFDDPDKMLQWALMARLAAESCTAPEAGSATRLSDLRARAWTQLGNSLRVKGFFLPAQQAITTAQHHLEAGTGDLSLRSWVLLLTACLSVVNGGSATAVDLAEQARRMSGAIGATIEEANSFLIESNAWYSAGDPDKAAYILWNVLPRPDFRLDSEWLYLARHNLVSWSLHAGQLRQALIILRQIRGGPEQMKNPLLLLRSLWAQGELLAKLGHLEAAEAALRRAHRGFLQKGIPRAIAPLCVQLVTLNRETGNGDRGETILAESLAALERLHAEPDALAPVLSLRDSGSI